MNIVMQAFMEQLPLSVAMRDNSLALIDRICSVYETARNDDADFAAEIMRVIRAVAVGGKVILLAGGPAAELLQKELCQDPLLWSVVSVERISVS